MSLPARCPLLIALALAAVAPLAAQDVPWTVFTEEATVRDAPEAQAPEVGRLAQGDHVNGEIVVDAETGEEWLAFERNGQRLHVSLNSLVRVHPDNDTGGDLPIGEEVVNRWWGLPLDYEPSDLVPIPTHLCVREDLEYRLRAETLAALTEMLRAAQREDVDIQVFSAHRSAQQQRRQFEEAVERRGPGQRAVARPGHSEHQLGTVVDLTDPPCLHAGRPSFAETPQHRWLSESAARFGFIQSYTEENAAETGIMAEPWHWRHIGR